MPEAPILPVALERNAAADAPYLVFHAGEVQRRLDAREAWVEARRWAAAMLAAGARRGDRVPILLPTSKDFVGAFLGAQLAGAVPVPLPTPLTFGRLDRTIERLDRIVTDADARLLVSTGRYARAAGAHAGLTARLRGMLDPEALGTPRAPTRWPGVDADDLALLQYTSGTSGDPKGVEITHRALAANTLAIAEALAIEPHDVGLSWLPVFHDMGLIGAICTPVTRPFEVHSLAPEAFIMRPRRWLHTLGEVGATISPAPNFAYALCTSRIDRPDELRLDGWRAALNGAETVYAATLDGFSDRFARAGFRRDAFTPVYGLAESTLVVTAPPPGRGPRETRFDVTALERGRAVEVDHGGRALVSVGVPAAGAEVRIAGAGGPVDAGVVGEIQTRGPSVMRGYFRRADASAASLDDGWLRTGDLGFVHGGELYVKGRAKDLIVQSGRNVYPDDVEQIALLDPAVRGAAAAFAVSDERRGTDALVVVVEVTERDPDTRARVAKAIRGRVLDALSVGVDEVALWPLGAIPRTTSGKVRRSACRDAWSRAS
ncbi:MAG: fatty acyl-AMP ligase [Sandaracinaceae bacterium]|nr:fatty acyl-AMP ligase [Sandaracinaceae bacterium]